MKVKTSQTLKVTARYSDGSSRDVTKLALYEANDREMAEATETGVVTTRDLPGNVAVMVRYGGKVSVFSISIPLGAPVDKLPPAKNFIDELGLRESQGDRGAALPVCDDATFLRRASLDIAGRSADDRGDQRLPRERGTGQARSSDRRPPRHSGLRRLLREQMDRAAQEQARGSRRYHRELRLPFLGPRRDARE